MSSLELNDIQGLVRHGYPYFEACAYLLFEIESASQARAWLAGLLQDKWIDHARVHAKDLLDSSKPAEERCGVSIAFTPSGLRKMRLPEAALRTFVSEFQEGMTAPHRSRFLGDVDDNCPSRWRWGGTHDRDRIDVLLMVFAAKPELDRRVLDVLAIPGCPRLLHDLRGRLGTAEPFGFADGISQPLIEGLHAQPAGMTRDPLIKSGEFVLGYVDEFGQHPASPTIERDQDPQRKLRFAADGRADFGRNGSFLVLRQLRQDVDSFSALASKDPLLAARIIGRWPDGSALVQYPTHDPARQSSGAKRDRAELAAENAFGYRRDDPHGFRCPLGAHVRRANPRDSLAGNGIDAKTARAMANRHRLLRRGRAYCDPQTGEEGLFFVCLNANIERQFEFVQRSWVMSAEFHGLRMESDPLLGAACAGSRTMTIQQPWKNECSPGLEQFVSVKGGGYFFLPGLRALEYLAS